MQAFYIQFMKGDKIKNLLKSTK